MEVQLDFFREVEKANPLPAPKPKPGILMPPPRINLQARTEPWIDSVAVSDALSFLKTLPDESVNCCVTSPPYFNLRRYLDDEREIGREATPEEFVEAIVTVFRELRRVLRSDGVAWIVLGDSYAANRSYQVRDNKHTNVGNDMPMKVPTGFKSKDRLMIPARVAIALQADGWWLRDEIVWHKPNTMPSSVTDRTTSAHEMVYMFAKSKNYFYDAEAIKEDAAYGNDSRGERNDRRRNVPGANASHPGRKNGGGNFSQKYAQAQPGHGAMKLERPPDNGKRNRRSVWTVNTTAFKGSHFATFPEALIRPMIEAGCPRYCCPECGKAWERIIIRRSERVNLKEGARPAERSSGAQTGGTQKVTLGVTAFTQRETVGWRPACWHYDQRYWTGFPLPKGRKKWQRTLSGDWQRRVRQRPGKDEWARVPGVVIDPFMGAGTSGLAAKHLNRHYTGCDLNPAYVAMGDRRIADDPGTR